MKIIALEVGSIGTNCYIAYSDSTRHAAVIDPGGNVDDILAIVRQENLKVDCIINTHGHADHVLGNVKLKQATDVEIMIHSKDAEMLPSPEKNLSAYIGPAAACGSGDRLLEEGDTVEVGDLKFSVIHTPGHTPGGICLLAGTVLFSGDTLFAESIGRTDFPGGSYEQIISSIKDKLMVLDDSTRVLPGHGPETTIGRERKKNPFIQ